MAENENNITLTIDGREVTVPKGTTVLEAARSVGIDIPTFCWHPKLKPVGACRICYVEIEKAPKLQVSCATEATAGMVVHTSTEKVKQGRRAVLEFLLINHPLDCPTCDKGGECDLQDITFAHGIDDSRFDFNKYRFIRDRKSTFDDFRIGPEIIRNQNRCILCYKCVRSNKEIFGEYDLGVFQRGNLTEIDAAPGQKVDSLYSGNLVEICPVGALTNTDWRYKIRVWKTKEVKSICGYCADGCNLKLWTARGKIFRATSRRNDEIDEGWICNIGRYGYQIANAANRLALPLIKKGDKQEPAGWDEAIELISRKLRDIRDKKGGVCIGGIISPMLDLASLYAFSKFFRKTLRSNNVDFRSEYKMLPEKSGDAYGAMTALKFKIADIEKSDLILVVGSNLMEEHPIVNLRVRKAATKFKASLYTINPIETKSADISTDEIIPRAGTLLAFINGLCAGVVEQNLTAEGADISSFKSLVEPNTVSAASEITGVSEERIKFLARAICQAKNISIIAGEFVTSSPIRESLALAINNLALLTGIYSKGQIGFLSKYCNSKGAEILGVVPSPATAKINKMIELWGAYPESEGLAADKMIRAAGKEEMDALFIVGADPIWAYPDGQFVTKGFEKLDFVVAADLFESETTAKADVVLPLSGWLEYAGEFVNLEGRLQKFEPARKSPGNAVPAFQFLNNIASEIDEPLYESWERLESEMKALLGSEETGAPPLSVLGPAKYTEEKTNPEYPLPLFILDDPHHFGHYTRESASLSAFCNEPYVEISPSLAEKLHVAAGDPLKIESEVGRAILPTKISEAIDCDAVIIRRNFSAAPLNMLQMRKKQVDRVKLGRVEGK
jgi:NADH-quinone oxidoreductase subunit G